MADKLVKTIPTTVVVARSEAAAANLSSRELSALRSVADRAIDRTNLLHQLDSYEQYQQLVFLKWLVETGRIERG